MNSAWVVVGAVLAVGCSSAGEGSSPGAARIAAALTSSWQPDGSPTGPRTGARRSISARVLRPGLPESCQPPTLVATDPALSHLPPFIDAVMSPDGSVRDVALVREDGSLWVVGGGREARRIDGPVRPGLSWSADGQRLAYARGVDPTDSDIWVADLRSGARVQVTSRPGPETRPAFAFDGQRLAWVGSQDGLAAIFVSDLRGGAARQVTNRGLSATGEGLPAGFVPPPVGPAAAQWEGDWLRYDAGDSRCAVHVVTGRARCGTVEGGR